MPMGGPISGGDNRRYDPSFSPHCIEPEDSADDPSVRVIVLWWAIREMKTSICLNIAGRTVTDDPGGIFSVHPTDNDVAKFSEDDVEPMIELCPALTDKFVKKKSRDSGRTVDFKKFQGGSLRIVSYGSVTKFRGSTVKVLLLHEVDSLSDARTAFLESLYKAMGRTQGLSDAIIVMESTGTSAPKEDEHGKKHYNSVIHEHYEKGDMRKWFCACQSCGHLQWLKYAQLQWPVGHMEQARYHCEVCDHPHNETEWRKMAREGKWYPTAGLLEEQLDNIAETWPLARAKQPEVRSYWRNGFNSLLPKSKGYTTKLHQFVAEGEAAKSSMESLKTWTNEIAAELWDPNTQGETPPEWKPLKDRAESYSTLERIIIPKGALILCAGADVHPNRIEMTWIAFGRGEESWVIDHQVFDGNIQDHSPGCVWEQLRKELQRQFLHELGGKLSLDVGMVDAGHGADDVLKFLQTIPMAGRLRACKGSSVHPFPVVSGYGQIVKGKRGKATLFGHFVGTHDVKDRLYERLRMVPDQNRPTPEGWVHFGERLPESYYEQLTAERARIHFGKSGEEKLYENTERKRNETLDCFVYAYASFRRKLVWDFDAREESLTVEIGEKPVEKKSRMRSVAGIL